MIRVRRTDDGKIFTSDMSKKNRIYEIHFCTSYTQVKVIETKSNGGLDYAEIICPSVGTTPLINDLIAITDSDLGVIL